jgi:predicted metal-binding protein
MNDQGKAKRVDKTGRGRGASRLISLETPLEALKKDLETFRQRALELGASMAEIIPANWVEVDERVRLKCFVPLCGHYGKNPHCPPHGPDVEFMRKALRRYSWAVLYALDVVPVSEFAQRTRPKTSLEWFRKNFEIAGEVETMACGSGYYLATAFSQGSCKAALCAEADGCRVLEGKGCANPLKSRPSMESVGIDVFGLVTRVGWDIYPIYRSVESASVPRALSVGIVFVY